LLKSFVSSLSGVAVFLLISTPTHSVGQSSASCSQYFAEDGLVDQYLVMTLEQIRHELRIPTAYLEDPWDRVQNSEHNAQLFRVTIEDFTPVTRLQSSERLRSGQRDYFSFVLGDLVPLEELLALQLRLSVPGLARRDPEFSASPQDYFDARSAEGELTAFKLVSEAEIRKDVFAVFHNDGGSTGVISCDPIGSARYPGCNHDLRAHGIDIRAGYSREYLPRWAEIQTRVSDFVGCLKFKND
jgi:hypothetical protein